MASNNHQTERRPDSRTENKSSKSPESERSIRDHKNPVIRFFAKSGYAIWIIILGIGGILAFFATIVAL
ncbi:MAG: hypothetical protein CMP12_07270 [Zunongwangia sp.]|jgi:hypothetical protein|uniref:Uncharacterized protein n=2 Tax=Zunongwangia profunda TaxID=398743 RepID=D5BIN9_ZUNPS|nr:hypothetical protein [Zunongwangia profunda]MAC63352.1 hypothetical protein [Flavobacteriaceae bacterium]MAO35705.1 hypothetical protein [Zunongwangia sp.]ADF51491.1 hypothetical protein ZPR_1146 [Zunongwangia profunda SM-A87]MAG86980.1 hypothetical protein [Flavobacteriaceae bacterium]MAS69344.1 hypothetical protein [Zunongwangia sp.]|tara:strand:+ start:1241 stop:1447 length:207 start_codon:yes stop_codon:yes gene_type:complete